MDSFDLSKISGLDSVEQNILNNQPDVEKSSNENKIFSENVTKPVIELDDFFEYLDPKVVEKILQTSAEARTRIIQDVQQYEYDLNGAKNIFSSLI